MKVITFCAAVGFASLAATAAYAQATRTWISGVGDDANPCSRTAPCKTFGGAISKTAAKGEINVLDPGGFGGVTITKSISIISDGAVGGVLVSGTNGIVINAAATDEVFLKGLELEGLGTGLNGVNILNAGSVVIEDTKIADFITTGVNLQTPSSTRLYLKNVTLIDNAIGLLVKASGANPNRAFVDDTHFFDSSTASVRVDGARSRVVLSNSYLASPTTDLVIVNSGEVDSYGDNVIRNGTPNATSNYK